MNSRVVVDSLEFQFSWFDFSVFGLALALLAWSIVKRRRKG